jgi:hypothetical protein
MLVVVLATVITATFSSSLLEGRGTGATSTVSDAPSSLASSAASMLLSVPPASDDAPPAAAPAIVGRLVALPDTGCPGLQANGQIYLLVFPTEYEWTEGREVTYEGTVVARLYDTVAVIGTDSGQESCWATSFSHSLEVVNIIPRQAQPTPSAAAFRGKLTSYCDLGTCCPALSVSGTRYALRLSDLYGWRPTPAGYELLDAGGAVVAREGEVVAVDGEQAGPDTCWASILEQSIRVDSIAK